MLFDYWIYNYGDTEAKDIKVKCVLLGEDYESLKVIKDDYGNLASNTVKPAEVMFETPVGVKLDTLMSGICYVESCSNCEILYKRIPEAVKEYEGLG